jgi:CYTH domain-containing protein/predicted ATPase
MRNKRLSFHSVPKFVLTGGPCSGKTTSIAYLVERLSDLGFTVFVVPETATLITNSGIDRRRMESPTQIVKYEELIFDLQIFLEEKIESSINEIFKKSSPVMLLDRGIVDIKAFLPEGYEKEFERMLKKRNMTPQMARERYTGVIHLVTCAEGKEEYYTLKGNSARIEPPELARKIDRKIRDAWLGHPSLKIIGNEQDFQEKIRRTFMSISKMLGIPVPKEKTKRYLVDKIEGFPVKDKERIDIEEVYLRSRRKNEEIKLRKRGQRGSYLYFVMKRYPHPSNPEGVEVEQMVTEEEYLRLLKLKDKKTVPLKKVRYCFLWENQYLKLDLFLEPTDGLKILTVDITEESERVSIPNFFKIREEITLKSMYEERNLALKNPKLL